MKPGKISMSSWERSSTTRLAHSIAIPPPPPHCHPQCILDCGIAVLQARPNWFVFPMLERSDATTIDFECTVPCCAKALHTQLILTAFSLLDKQMLRKQTNSTDVSCYKTIDAKANDSGFMILAQKHLQHKTSIGMVFGLGE